MSVVYNNTVKDDRLQIVIDAINGDAANGYLEIGTSGMSTVLATIVFDDPPATKSGQVITISGVPLSDTNADDTGTAAEARIRDGADNDIVTGLTVGTDGGNNVILDSVSITSGQTVTLNSGTITHG